MKKTILLILLAVLLLTLAACAAGPNPTTGTTRGETREHPAGFLLGLWHGIIAPIAFVVSLFNRNVGIYEVYNNGGWYNFGFLLGLSITFGGGGGTAQKARSKQEQATPEQ